MNIQRISNLNFLHFSQKNDTARTTNYGLRISEPLKYDTVSFQSIRTKGAQKAAKAVTDGIRSNKKMGDVEITTKLAKDLRKAVTPAHNENVMLFYRYFSDVLSELDANKNIVNRNLLTFMERIKGEYSVIQKASSIAQDENIAIDKINKKTLLKNMTDISGMGVILEKAPDGGKKSAKKQDDRAMIEAVKRLSKMIKDKAIKVEEVEYHVRAPEYDKNGKIAKTFDTMNRTLVDSLMNTAQEINPDCKCHVVSNPIGYSGLHVKLKNSDGTYTEFKILARAIANIQDIENMFYKVQNGKKVAPQYEKEVGEYLAQLKPLDEYATQEEIELFEKVTKTLKEYKKEIYALGVESPLEDINDFPAPKNPLIQQYGFNIIRDKMARCSSKKK